MRYDAVVFDLDGTLLDTLEDLRSSVNHALRLHGFPERSLEEIRCFVGNGVRNLMRLAVPGGEEEPAFEAVFADFKAHYADHWCEVTRPYDGIAELVEELACRNVALAVVSNKSDAEVKKLCEVFFGGRMASALGERPGVARKPAPDSVFHTLEALGVPAERAMYVGDTEVDIRTARNAGVDCVAVSWGFRSRKELREAGAVEIIDRPSELLTYL